MSAGLPRVDRTYKLFYGGAQKRPDGNYSRVVLSADGAPLAQVAESNRKDVRNAVEAAQKGQPGWAKRSGHQRAQILYYLAENLELRRAEFANTLERSTGCSREQAENEVSWAGESSQRVTAVTPDIADDWKYMWEHCNVIHQSVVCQ